MNPGPVKDPCGICSKCVRKNEHGIACDGCEIWFHRNCLNMDIPTYQKFCDDADAECLCYSCSAGDATSGDDVPAQHADMRSPRTTPPQPEFDTTIFGKQ